MTFELRMLVVVLSAFVAAGVVGSAVVPALSSRAARQTAWARSRTLFYARLLPTAFGLFASGLAFAAYLLFERCGPEPTGLLLPALAICGVLMAVAAALRLARTMRATSVALSQWMRTADAVTLPGVTIPAFAVDAAFPVVAVVGIRRPRLVIARSVLEACTRDELAAILVHEQHHVDRRDNFRRAVMIALPDLFAWLPASRRLLADWREAGEDAADEAAERLGAHGRLLLAQALIRVARLAPPDTRATPVMASATGTRARFCAPAAISRATCSLTAPCWRRVSAETPRSSCLAAFE